MNDDVMISVIMSTYKTDKQFLDESINSILNQTFKNFEFIIICDGDREEYNYINKKYKDSRIKLLLHDKNMGLAKSLNDGIKNALGKYIARMDSDDISYKNRLDVQYNYMENNKNIMVCGSYAKNFGASNKKQVLVFNNPEEIDIQLLYYNCLIHSSVMIRRDYLVNNNYLYDETYTCSQDYELWSRISNKNFYVIPKVLLKYRVHAKQASQEKSKIQVKLRHDVFKRNIKKYNWNSNYFSLFKLLSGEILITKANFDDIVDIINDFINENTSNYNKKDLKVVFYNRLFQLILFERNINLLFNYIFNPFYYKYFWNCYNIKYVIVKMFS